MSNEERLTVDLIKINKEHVDAAKKKQCLQTALYEVAKKNPFLGTVLQCMDIFYSHQLPTAGVGFDNNGKKWNMAINPKWFCDKLSDKEREAILLHEIYHLTHKHPMRAPFLKINSHRRLLMNIAMDMSINQYIPNLPMGCPQCPPLDLQEKGNYCQNENCPGRGITVHDYFDLDKAGARVPWPTFKAMEFYYHKLIERYVDKDTGRDPTLIKVEHIFLDPLDIVATGRKDSKRLNALANGSLAAFKSDLAVGGHVLLPNQGDARDNGIYEIEDLGSDTTPFVLKRHPKHSGTITNPVYVGDAAVDKHQKIVPGKKVMAWAVTGEARAADSKVVMVDQSKLTFAEQEVQTGGGGKGLPKEFDSHQWDENAEETDMMDATEELVKRAMQKRGLTMDRLPGFVQELLADIEARRTELNYRQLILSAIKRHASGWHRESSWTRPSRRFGNKSPGTKNGNLPKLANYIDSSGSISIQEANDFLDIIDNFLKVGSRKCTLGLWHTQLYDVQDYRLGERMNNDSFNSRFQSGGTDPAPALRHIWETKPDLAIILTDGCYGDVDVESWLRPGEHFPQILWIISRDGAEDHPLKRLGETIKIPNTDSMGADRNLEK